MKPTPPSICVRVHHDVTREDLLPLLLGIEEEGVPVEVTRHEQLNPLTLAHEAAIESALGIGVGVALDYVVITTEKLPEDRPYIARFLADADGPVHQAIALIELFDELAEGFASQIR